MLENYPVTTTIAVTDMGRAKKFYGETLGLKESGTQIPGGVMYEAGAGTKLFVYERPNPAKADHTLASFDVDDIEKVMGELKAKGVVFEEYDFPGLKTVNGVAMMDGVKSAWFKDPEGHILALGQAG